MDQEDVRQFLGVPKRFWWPALRGAWSVSMTLFALWALGWAPFETPGFITSQTMASVEANQAVVIKQVNELNRQSLVSDMVTARQVQCSATDKRYASDRLRSLMGQYFALTGLEWRIPECDQV